MIQLFNRKSLLLVLFRILVAPAAWPQAGPNVDDLAKELSNPGAANATLNFKLEYRTFDGDVAGADEQNSTTLTFQPVLPFVLPNGNNLIFRPAFPYVWGQPTPGGSGGFSNTDNFGDIGYDLLYSWQANGFTLGAGVVGSIPVGTDLSSENWTARSELPCRFVRPVGAFGVLFPFHNEKIGGSGPDTSITSLQYFLFYSLGNGWQVGTGTDESLTTGTLPTGRNGRFHVQLALAKTTAIGSQLIKLNFSAERNVHCA